MPFVSVGQENSGSIELYYEDHGKGKPVVLVHGWPLSGASWERQVPVLLEAGRRVITYDRRGFGRSAQPASGYDYDTLTADLDALITKLDLRDITLVGFSMGGGEVARYLGSRGSERIERAVFMSAIPPFLLKTPDNEEGVEASVFDGLREGLIADRPAFLAKFFADFYNVDVLRGKAVSDEVVRLSWNIASGASPIGTLQTVSSWLTDFREDVKRIDVPTLIIHGNKDRIVPLAASGARMPALIRDGRLVEIEGAPHGLNWTHAEEANRALLDFLKPSPKGVPRVNPARSG